MVDAPRVDFKGAILCYPMYEKLDGLKPSQECLLDGIALRDVNFENLYPNTKGYNTNHPDRTITTGHVISYVGCKFKGMHKGSDFRKSTFDWDTCNFEGASFKECKITYEQYQELKKRGASVDGCTFLDEVLRIRH